MHKRINQFVWPALLANLSTPILSLGDTAIIGHFASSTDLSAVAAGAAVMSMAVGLFGFLRMGTTGEVARAFGENSTTAVNQAMQHSLLIALSVGALVCASLWVFLPWAVDAINPNNPSSPLTGDYIAIRSFGTPAALWLFVVNGWLLGIQRPMYSLWLATGINVINLLLSFVAVASFNGGAKGAALATVCAEYCGVGFSLYWLRHGNVFDRNPIRIGLLKQLLRQNGDLLLRSIFLMFSMTYFTAQSARLGDQILAMNSIILNILLVVSYALDGIANATEALTGEAIGSKNRNQFYQLLKATSLWTLIFGVAFSTGFYLANTQLIAWFTQDTAIITASEAYMLWLVSLPLISVWAYYLDGVFIGANKLSAMRNIMIIASFSYIGLWEILQNHGYSNHGLWFCFVLLHLLRVFGLAGYMWHYHRSNQWF